METETEPLYPASLLVKALGVHRKSILSRLRKREADGEVKVRGVRARGWRLKSLPVEWLGKLAEAARASGHRTPRELLESFAHGATVEPPRPALTPTLYMASDSFTGQLVRPGAAHPSRLHFKSFEAAVRWSWEQGCHFVMLHSGGRGPVKLSKLPVVPLDLWREITGGDNRAANPDHPASRLIWLRAFERFEIEKSRRGISPKQARLDMLRFLWRTSPFLAKSENALRVKWDRLYSRWVDLPSVDALEDRRLKQPDCNRAADGIPPSEVGSNLGVSSSAHP